MGTVGWTGVRTRDGLQDRGGIAVPVKSPSAGPDNHEDPRRGTKGRGKG